VFILASNIPRMPSMPPSVCQLVQLVHYLQ